MRVSIDLIFLATLVNAASLVVIEIQRRSVVKLLKMSLRVVKHETDHDLVPVAVVPMSRNGVDQVSP